MTTTTTITRPVPHATEFDRYYTVAQAAALLGVSRVSVWRWIRDGQLPAQRLGQRTTRIKREDVDLLRGAVTPAQDVDHTVQFYEDDAVVLNAAAAFIGAGLGAGDVGIVVVTQPHREGIAARLCAAGIDVSSAVAEGRYIALDAADMLTRFMVAGAPHAKRFALEIGGIVARAAARQRPVHIFGEMVGLLAAAGNGAAAVALERLWNDLQCSHRFSLLCAYPIGYPGADLLGAVCAAHSRVIPAESYSQLPTEKDRLQAVVALQHAAHRQQTRVVEQHEANAAR